MHKELTKDLSIIIPFCNEFPQIAFTVNNIFCELRDSGIDFEIIVIDNWCSEVGEQVIKTFTHNTKENEPKEIYTKRMKDPGSGYMESITKLHPWLTYIKYDKKLSHWQAKNAGVSIAKGKTLWFCDSHCIISKNSLVDMFNYYVYNYAELNGTLHLPLSYMLEAPGKELVYKLVLDLPKGVVHYSFTRHNPKGDHYYRVPCMSTCGMMMSRDLYNSLGGWPEELGIYGGGENFINFSLAIMGKNINIFNTKPLYHYAAKRGYNWNHTDFHRNRTIASYMYGDKKLANLYVHNIKGRPEVLDFIYNDITTKISCIKHRLHISKQQKLTIEEWCTKWSEKI